MIVFPMAGESRRFREAGYEAPKYMLPLHGRPAFDYAVAGFLALGEPLAFVLRDVAGTRAFVQQRLAALGVADARIAVLSAPTAGQAETVEQGLAALGLPDGEPLGIFNVDTFRKDVRRPRWEAECDGWLEVFEGEGAGWSFVAPGSDGAVLRTTEKEPISRLCCTGLYRFASAGLFRRALAAERAAPDRPLPELYVAPLYNHLIGEGRDVRYDLIPRDDVAFCGVPEEYEALRQQGPDAWTWRGAASSVGSLARSKD